MASIYSIEKIERDARQAALRYHDVNDACPYPFDTTAGYVFRNAFLAARRLMPEAAQQSAPSTAKATP